MPHSRPSTGSAPRVCDLRRPWPRRRIKLKSSFESTALVGLGLPHALRRFERPLTLLLFLPSTTLHLLSDSLRVFRHLVVCGRRGRRLTSHVIPPGGCPRRCAVAARGRRRSQRPTVEATLLRARPRTLIQALRPHSARGHGEVRSKLGAASNWAPLPRTEIRTVASGSERHRGCIHTA